MSLYHLDIYQYFNNILYNKELVLYKRGLKILLSVTNVRIYYRTIVLIL